MSFSFEKTCFDIYKSIKAETFEKIVPVIDFTRKLKNKPQIPLKEKLAQIKYPTLKNDVIMLHGVSVGEILSLENLVKKIKEFYPDYSLVITAGTKTGLELAQKKYAEIADFITYFPLDIYGAVENFLNAIRPSVVLIAETELWPNFSDCCYKKEIPLYLINARISDKSYPSYKRIKNFISLVLNNYSGIFCQSELDKERFIELGAKKEKVLVMKNLKFEIEKKDCDIDLSGENNKIFIAGSTHKGEDEIVLKTYKKLKNKIPNLKLILAPRHLTRMDDVIKLCQKTKIKFGQRTKNDTFKDNDIIILDTLGELSKIYSITDVAFIGGSFNKTGGHNPLEAIIYSKPTLSGPCIKNFKDIYSILERQKAAFVVKNEKQFYKILEKLLTDDIFYQTVSNNSKRCFIDQQGAMKFVLNKLGEILD